MQRQIDWVNLSAGVLAWLGVVQFVGCVYLAIHYYPTDGHSPNSAYSLTENFLSDLGCTATDTGRDNAHAAGIFNPSVVVLGMALMPFLLLLPVNMQRGRIVLQIAGAVSALGLVGIGLTPYNQYFVAHHVALGVWLLPLLVIVTAYFAVTLQRGEASPALLVTTVLLLGAMFGYASAGSHGGYVIFQKIMACAAVGWFVLVCGQLGVVTVQTISRRRQIVQKQAELYLETIQRGYRRRR